MHTSRVVMLSRPKGKKRKTSAKQLKILYEMPDKQWIFEYLSKNDEKCNIKYWLSIDYFTN